VPENLKTKTIFALDMGALMAVLSIVVILKKGLKQSSKK